MCLIRVARTSSTFEARWKTRSVLLTTSSRTSSIRRFGKHPIATVRKNCWRRSSVLRGLCAYRRSGRHLESRRPRQRRSPGLAPGVVIQSDSVTFRDEDFETHLRGVIGPQDALAAHHRLATYFMARDEREPEAATVIAEHLFRSRQFAELVALTLARREPTAIQDPVVRMHVYRRRLAFAIRAALEEGALADACRLTILAGELARSNSAVVNVVRQAPDLAGRHGDPAGVAEIYLRRKRLMAWTASSPALRHLRAEW